MNIQQQNSTLTIFGFLQFALKYLNHSSSSFWVWSGLKGSLNMYTKTNSVYRPHAQKGFAKENRACFEPKQEKASSSFPTSLFLSPARSSRQRLVVPGSPPTHPPHPWAPPVQSWPQLSPSAQCQQCFQIWPEYQKYVNFIKWLVVAGYAKHTPLEPKLTIAFLECIYMAQCRQSLQILTWISKWNVNLVLL